MIEEKDEVKNEIQVIKPRSDPTKSSDAGFINYLKEIQKFPILTAEEEYEYGMKYKKDGDPEAAKKLLQSHLRLVVKMAGKFRKYGLPITDLVSEGNVGLVQAVKKFDPEKGFRFSTYAMWWIRAHIQEYILRSWSLVKIGTTVAQKKLFFNLHKIKKRIKGASEGSLSNEHIERIAKDLNVSKQEVIDMNSRLSQSDSSLNAVIGEDDDGEEVVNLIAANQESQEEIAIENQEKSRQEMMLKEAMASLNEREQDIVVKRLMSENPMTLEELSQAYNISRERVRQIEANALEKIKKFVAKMQKRVS
ncbi:MAG: RNA polymerase sigma factor RpoH [Rickettsiales bacterium]|nr:RNA polymerase sigma factor RpoH [Rickettsiales bacterium]